jgi:hypothetical protein
MKGGIVFKPALIKTIATALLIAAFALPSARQDGLTYGLLLFGLANVFLDIPGATSIRICSAVVGVVALAFRENGTVVWSIILAWLLWPPAVMVAWTQSRRSKSNGETGPTTSNAAAKRARIALSAIIAAAAIGSIAYRLIVFGHLQQTAALFIGIPALLAIVVVFGISPRSATGVACKAVTVGLLVSLLFLGEGMLCIAMSAPLFYFVAIAIAAAMEAIRKQQEKQRKLYSCLILLAVVPLSLEGVLPVTTFNRNETVMQTKIVHAASRDIERALVQPPRFDRKMPLYLRAGFPRPVLTEIDKTSNGTRWRIRFRGGEMRITGLEPKTGDLILILDELRPGHARWRAVSDTSHMTHFLQWRETILEWTPIDGENSRVTWTIQYERGLDPAWYFGPLEQYAVRLAAGYLIDSVATP